MENDSKHIKKLYNKIYNELIARIPEINLNGDEVNIQFFFKFNFFFLNLFFRMLDIMEI
jgi:hypothetical protein